MQPDKMEERLKRYEGLTGMARTRQFILDLWTWAGEKRKVYWVADEERIRTFENSLPLEWPDRFRIVASIEMPKTETPGRPEGPGGMGPGFAGPPGVGPASGPPGDRPVPRMTDRLRRGAGGGPLGMGGLLSGEKLALVEWTSR
jgi:hypothetical protein